MRPRSHIHVFVPCFAALRARWTAGSCRIRFGLAGSLLTCIAGTLANNALEHITGHAPSSLAARVGAAYSAAVLVVVLVFPLLRIGSGSVSGASAVARMRARAVRPGRSRL